MFENCLPSHGYFLEERKRDLGVGRTTLATIWGRKSISFEADHQLIHWIHSIGNQTIARTYHYQLIRPPTSSNKEKWGTTESPSSLKNEARRVCRYKMSKHPLTYPLTYVWRLRSRHQQKEIENMITNDNPNNTSHAFKSMDPPNESTISSKA